MVYFNLITGSIFIKETRYRNFLHQLMPVEGSHSWLSNHFIPLSHNRCPWLLTCFYACWCFAEESFLLCTVRIHAYPEWKMVIYEVLESMIFKLTRNSISSHWYQGKVKGGDCLKRSRKVIVLYGHPELTVDNISQTPPKLPVYTILNNRQFAD